MYVVLILSHDLFVFSGVESVYICSQDIFAMIYQWVWLVSMCFYWFTDYVVIRSRVIWGNLPFWTTHFNALSIQFEIILSRFVRLERNDDVSVGDTNCCNTECQGLSRSYFFFLSGKHECECWCNTDVFVSRWVM